MGAARLSPRRSRRRITTELAHSPAPSTQRTGRGGPFPVDSVICDACLNVSDHIESMSLCRPAVVEPCVGEPRVQDKHITYNILGFLGSSDLARCEPGPGTQGARASRHTSHTRHGRIPHSSLTHTAFSPLSFPHRSSPAFQPHNPAPRVHRPSAPVAPRCVPRTGKPVAGLKVRRARRCSRKRAATCSEGTRAATRTRALLTRRC